jgi:hypothetical protein
MSSSTMLRRTACTRGERVRTFWPSLASKVQLVCNLGHAFQLDQAHAAGRFGLARPIHGAQVRDLDARARGRREHGLAGCELNFFPIDHEAHTQALSSLTR